MCRECSSADMKTSCEQTQLQMFVLLQNIELKVEVESLKQELQEKQQLLDKALYVHLPVSYQSYSSSSCPLWTSESAAERERERECVCVREREREECVCVCVRERERSVWCVCV